MIKITELFEVTKGDNDLESDIPMMTPPHAASNAFEKDIDSVIFHHDNPCLNTQFLDLSHNSVKEVYKQFCKETGLRLNWKLIGSILDEVESIVSKLKKHHQRPRPKIFLVDKSDKFLSIKDMKSYSFPSGHTAIAYFLSELLSSYFPDSRSEFENIAALIGQSRIENAVHFPTDVTYGRFLGEHLFSNFTNSGNKFDLHKKRSNRQNKKFAKHLIEKNNNVNNTIDDIANFLYNTNFIEGKAISKNECKQAAKRMLTGIKDHGISRNLDLRSQCAALRESFYIKNYSPSGIVRIHKQFDPNVLDKGMPGELRLSDHRSPTGIQYSSPTMLASHLSTIRDCNDPLMRHFLYEWIHPFCDGNGRSGRVLLAQDMDYDFKKVNNILQKNYIQKMDEFFHENNMIQFFN